MRKNITFLLVLLITVGIVIKDSNISDASSNLIDSNNIEYGYIDANDKLLPSHSHITTHYISVAANTCIQFNTYGQGSYHRVLFYDSNKRLIDRHTATVASYTPYTRIMRGATRYIRYSPNIDNYPYDKTYTARVVDCEPYVGKVVYGTNGNNTYNKSHSTKVTVSGHDTVKNDIEYAWSTSTSTPTSGWAKLTNNQTLTRSSGTGNYYLHVRGTNWVGETFNFRSNVFRVDNTAPSHTSSTISGARYVNGTTYWVRPNDVLTVSNRQYDGHSGNKYGYIRLIGNSQDVRYYHDFDGESTNMVAVSDTHANTSSIQVLSVSRTENSGGYGTLQWKAKLNSSGHSYDIQYYYRDKAANTVGYTTVTNVRVDGVEPTLNLIQDITEKTDEDVTITAIASDTLSGVKRIKLPNNTWVNGNQASYKVSENGTYTFEVEDNVGNTHIKSITVSNIDKTPLTAEILPNVTEKTHDNVILNINVPEQKEIKRIMYIGKNMIKNGDFSEGSDHWTNSGGNEGEFILTPENTVLLQSPVNENKIKQTNAFLGSAHGVTYQSEIIARGNGVLNVRYGVYGSQGGTPSREYKQELTDENNFKVYRFPIERGEFSNNNLIIEKIGSQGWVELKDVKVFEQKDITDTRKLEVTRNGLYTFVVEDTLGNIVTESIEVTNIERELTLESFNVTDFKDVYISENIEYVTADLEPIIVSDWREDSNSWKLNVTASQLKHEDDEFTLPTGTIKIKPINNIEKLDGTGNLPVKKYTETVSIDEGVITLVDASDSRGEYKIGFPKGALEVTIKNHEIKQGKYTSVITWELLNVP